MLIKYIKAMSWIALKQYRRNFTINSLLKQREWNGWDKGNGLGIIENNKQWEK